MRILKYFLLVIMLILQVSCNALKYKPVDAREFPSDPKERVKKNIEEGRGFRIMGSGSLKGNNFEFASSNPLWQATLETLDFIPLATANYSGGIIITDWYSENNKQDESIKITVRFLTNEIRSDALDITIFLKTCLENQVNCPVSQSNDSLITELKNAILKKAARIEKEKITKNKKDNPYMGTQSAGGDSETTN